MKQLKWKRSVLSDIEGIYCLELFHTNKGFQVVAAGETHGGVCKSIDFATRNEEQIWDGPGGCMNVSQLNEEGSVVAIQNFYKGFQSKEAQVVRADKVGGEWKTTVLAVIPYLHRSGVVHTESDGDWIVCSQLCTERNDAADWSHPGKILAAKVPALGEQIEFRVLQEGVTKNHGFWQGKLDGEEVTLIGGTEGLFRVRPPKGGKDWQVDKLLDREVSDVAVADLDGDGEDELVVFDGFHGELCTVNKRVDGVWTVVYELPMHFSHAIWAGELLGRNMFAVGYRKEDGKFYVVEHTAEGYKAHLIEEGIAPSNCRGFVYEGKSYLAVAARDMDQVVLFELTEEEA
ncbi:MAG: hypothetical protein Q4C53_03570 [Clostridia bacterium]|nr:hypothetical protein [Clostridia bacterium]